MCVCVCGLIMREVCFVVIFHVLLLIRDEQDRQRLWWLGWAFKNTYKIVVEKYGN
jgi:hypothetical protein